MLGRRWIYDGSLDPVLLEQLAELIQGRVGAQAQNQSDTPDATVDTMPVAAAPGQRVSISFARLLSPHANAAGPGEVTGPWKAADGTVVRSLFATARPLVE